MEYIAHRINTVAQLRDTPPAYGVELDIRDSLDGRLYLQHDPFTDGESFEDYLKEYCHGTIIVNVKSEQTEIKAMELLRKYHCENYFFLDSSFPMIKRLTDMGEHRIALRYSEYEGMDTLRNMAGLIEWVWIDCFTKMPLSGRDYLELRDLGYKLCLVSPDLVGREQEIDTYRCLLNEQDIEFDAVCGKVYHAEKWMLIRKQGLLRNRV